MIVLEMMVDLSPLYISLKQQLLQLSLLSF